MASLHCSKILYIYAPAYSLRNEPPLSVNYEMAPLFAAARKTASCRVLPNTVGLFIRDS